MLVSSRDSLIFGDEDILDEVEDCEDTCSLLGHNYAI